MNALQLHIQQHDLNEYEVMDRLQINSIISDECVWAQDVSEGDCERAVKFLNNE